MANPERGEVRLEVEGTTYTLKITMGAAIELQQKKSKSMGQLFADVADMDVDAIVGLVWASLQAHHPRQFKTEQNVIALMDSSGSFPNVLTPFVTALVELIDLNKATTKAGESTNPLPAQTGGTVENSTSKPDASSG